MSSPVAFDTRGVFGPMVTLLYQTPQTEADLKEVTKLLKDNYTAMSIGHITPEHRQEFCSYVLAKIAKNKSITPAIIIKTAFFKSMRSPQPSPIHDDVVTTLVPNMLKQIVCYVPRAGTNLPEDTNVHEWIGRCVESYLSEEQLTNFIDYYKLLHDKPEIQLSRQLIAKELGAAMDKGEFTEKDLDALLDILKGKTEEEASKPDNAEIVKSIAQKYTELFQMAGTLSQMIFDNVFSSLNNPFRKKLQSIPR